MSDNNVGLGMMGYSVSIQIVPGKPKEPETKEKTEQTKDDATHDDDV